MIKANELRIGSKLNYDTAEGEILPTVIDWQDLKWLTEDPKGFNLVHSPIPLTEEILLKCGFLETEKRTYELTDFKDSVDLCVTLHEEKTIITLWSDDPVCFRYQPMKVHQLQDLYFALTGEELNIEI